MNRKAVIITLLLLATGAVLAPRWLAAEDLKIAITKDNSICMDSGERKLNMGGSSRIKLKADENAILLAVDTAAMQNKLLTKAVLHIRGTDTNMMVRKVDFSTLACSPWSEGVGNGEAANQGDSTFFTPEFGSDRLWGGPDSDFYDVIGGRCGTIWMQAYVKPGPDMWYEMEIDPRLLEACAAGLSGGILMHDGNGQVKEMNGAVMPGSNYGNNLFYSKEQAGSEPYFTAVAQPAAKAAGDTLAVEVKPWQAGADFEKGGVEISWPGPLSDKEYRSMLGARVYLTSGSNPEVPAPLWTMPPLPKPGETARLLLSGQEPGASLTARVEVVTRGGQVLHQGSASGQVSDKFPEPQALSLQAVAGKAGDPPSNSKAKVWVVPDGVKVNPLTGNVQEEDGVTYEGDPAGTYRQANAVWSGGGATINLAGLKGEWVGFQIVCENAGTDPVSYHIKPGSLSGASGVLIQDANVGLSRMWYIKNGDKDQSWYEDPMVPLKNDEAFGVPWDKNAVPGQKNQAIYTEFFIPKSAAPGAYTGVIQVFAGDESPVALNVNLTVGNGAIPDEAHLILSMNNYQSPGGNFEEKDFLQGERAFYRMAHDHRTDICIVPYSHIGNIQRDYQLPLAGTGSSMRVADWSAWDKRFGPLFDGTVFKGSPRENAPLSHFNLMFSENYPTTMAQGYKYNNLSWENCWKENNTPWEDFSDTFKAQWVAVAKDFIKHVKEKGWQTSFQVLLNDKSNYKAADPTTKQPGKGVSFWRLDEPAYTDDFLTVQLIGRLLKQAQEGDRNHVLFRCDVSYPERAWTMLSRVLDLDVCSNLSYLRFLQDDRERYGVGIWNYSGAPSCQESNLGISAMAMDLFGRSVDGYVPWKAIGSDFNWNKFDDFTSVIYTGGRWGIIGPCASLRLKAYRRAEQDVEYLWLLANKRGLLNNDPNHKQVARLLTSSLNLQKTTSALDNNGGVVESFKSIKPDQLESLRRAIAGAL